MTTTAENAPRPPDGDWLGTAYFGEKTSIYYREHLELAFFNHFLKDKGDPAGFETRRLRRLSSNSQTPCGCGHQPGNQPQQRRLAASRRAQ